MRYDDRRETGAKEEKKKEREDAHLSHDERTSLDPPHAAVVDMLVSVAASCSLVESVDVDINRCALLGLFVVDIRVGRGSGAGAGARAQFFLHDRRAKARKRVTGVERTGRGWPCTKTRGGVEWWGEGEGGQHREKRRRW